MSKTGGRVKALREKARHQRRDHNNGGFARFSTPSVDTVEANVMWYDGDNTPSRFRDAAHARRTHQGTLQYVIPEYSAKIERRDGGYHRQADARAVSVNTGDAKIRKVATHKVVTREHLRASLGTGSLLNTCWSQPKVGAAWPLYNSKGVRIG